MMIRPATPLDAAGICEVWNPLIKETATTFSVDLKQPNDVKALITERNGAFFVAEARGAILGFSTYFPFRNGPGYRHTKEHSINLAPSAAGKGVGRGLMQMLETHAVQNDVHCFIAGISSENPAAVAFHESLGFHHVARLPGVGFKFGRWMDLVLMQKFLSQ